MVFPKKVIFGIGSIEKIGEEARSTGSKKALIVIDPVVAKTGVAEKISKIVEKQGVEVDIFDKVEPEPKVEKIHESTKIVREKRFDLVIGIGGGSSLDVAKATSVMATNPGQVEDYFGAFKITKHRLNLILSPTTAGTGSEATSNYVLSDSRGKQLTFSPEIFPDTTLVDPTLTMTMPPKVTANTGFDALAHAVESMLSVDSNEITEALNLKAIRLIGKYLRIAYYQGQNMEARRGMSLAALSTALAFANTGLVVGHGAAMQLGAKFHIPHGEGCALALPYAMDYNLPVAAEKLACIASALGVDVVGLAEEDAARKGIRRVKALVEELGVRSTLKQFGVQKTELEVLTDEYLRERIFEINWNPRASTKEGILKFYENMWAGVISEA
jgi:alcohol dehydrogenase class IV